MRSRQIELVNASLIKTLEVSLDSIERVSSRRGRGSARKWYWIDSRSSSWISHAQTNSWWRHSNQPIIESPLQKRCLFGGSRTQIARDDKPVNGMARRANLVNSICQSQSLDLEMVSLLFLANELTSRICHCAMRDAYRALIVSEPIWLRQARNERSRDAVQNSWSFQRASLGIRLLLWFVAEFDCRERSRVRIPDLRCLRQDWIRKPTGISQISTDSVQRPKRKSQFATKISNKFRNCVEFISNWILKCMKWNRRPTNQKAIKSYW